MSLLDYENYEILGTGAMGVVHLAKKKNKKEVSPFVALKIVDKAKIESRALWDMMMIERKVGIKAREEDNKFVTRILECFMSPSSFVFVLEHMKFGSIQDFLKDQEDIRLKSENAKFFLFELLKGVFFVHDLNLIHRDIKPQNILVTEDGNIQLADFGFSIPKDAATHGNVPHCGTMEYSPNESLALKPVQKSDFFAIGVVLFEMLTGICPPFKIPMDPSQLDFPKDFLKALSAKPDAIHLLKAEEQEMFNGLTNVDLDQRFDKDILISHSYFIGLNFEENTVVPAPFSQHMQKFNQTKPATLVSEEFPVDEEQSVDSIVPNDFKKVFEFPEKV